MICSAAASTTGSAPSTSALPTEADAIVVGAGVAGLAAALALQKVRSPITETVRDALTARKATGARRWSFVWLPKGTLLTAVREAPVQAGLKPLVLEASDDVGGRVRTDKVRTVICWTPTMLAAVGWVAMVIARHHVSAAHARVLASGQRRWTVFCLTEAFKSFLLGKGPVQA